MNTNGSTPAAELSGLAWRKSSYSTAQGNCVEFAALPVGRVAVRDSRQPGGDALVLTHATWRAFCSAVKTGDTGHM
jgi:Domain of unknown function (DUF397)